MKKKIVKNIDYGINFLYPLEGTLLFLCSSNKNIKII